MSSVGAGLTTIDGGQIGSALGTVLGRRLTTNPFGQIAASAVLGTALGVVGEFIDEEIFGGTSSTNLLGRGLDGVVDSLGATLAGSRIGALSSYLTADLIGALGIDGFAGELANSVGGSVVSQVISNIAGLNGSAGTANPFNGVGPLLVVNAVGSLLGSKLASEVISFNSVGGQIGSAVGGISGGFGATVALAALAPAAEGASLATLAASFAAANPVAAVVVVAAVVFVTTIVGGLIGSVFGGTPRSGADVEWDAGTQRFAVANVYSKKGGSKETAQGLASAVAETFNGVLEAAGGVLLDPEAVQSGSYGMRGKDLVYRPVHTRDKDAITFRLPMNRKDAFAKMIAHGVYNGLADPDFRIAGGNVYVKRALYNGFAIGGVANDNGLAARAA